MDVFARRSKMPPPAKNGPPRKQLWNHVPWNRWLTTKKGLYFSLRAYCRAAKAADAPKGGGEGAAGSGEGEGECEGDSGGGGGGDNGGGEGDNGGGEGDNGGGGGGGAPALRSEGGGCLALEHILPETFFANNANADEEGDGKCELQAWMAIAAQSAPENNYWIVKPAAGSNQGDGIHIVGPRATSTGTTDAAGPANSEGTADAERPDSATSADVVEQVERLLYNPSEQAERRGWTRVGHVIQRYMARPLLVAGRKFDIRVYALLVQREGETTSVEAWVYDDYYVRTTSTPYSLDCVADSAAHLTNDAVQKHEASYGLHEASNKLDAAQFERAVRRDYGATSIVPDWSRTTLLPAMRERVRLSVLAAQQAAVMAKEGRLANSSAMWSDEREEVLGWPGVHCYELLGYDFMLDENFDVRLIEVL